MVFILSKNASNQPKNLDNYYIYRIFKVNSTQPKIYKIVHSFKNDNIDL